MCFYNLREKEISEATQNMYTRKSELGERRDSRHAGPNTAGALQMLRLTENV